MYFLLYTMTCCNMYLYYSQKFEKTTLRMLQQAVYESPPVVITKILIGDISSSSVTNWKLET